MPAGKQRSNMSGRSHVRSKSLERWEPFEQSVQNVRPVLGTAVRRPYRPQMRLLLRLATLMGLITGSALTGIAAEPVRLIFDTDIGNDVDDALALGVIHALQTRGQCRLLAVTITKDNEAAAAFVDAVNHFYGRPDIPIGVVRDGMTPDAGKFITLAHQTDGDRLRYPHSLTSGRDAEEATRVLRRVLAAQPDGSVAIAQVGFSTNLARLLSTPADEFSPLDGRELIKQKVSVLSIMAGSFQTIRDNNHFLEYNVVKDIPNCQKLIREWPGRVVFSGFEVGISVPYPSESILRDYGYVEHHPLAEAYHLYNPPPHDRPTWDLTSVLYAVHPDRNYFELSAPGTVTIEDDGFTRFRPDTNGRHQFLIATPRQIPRITEALVQLSSQPPQKLPKAAK